MTRCGLLIVTLLLLCQGASAQRAVSNSKHDFSAGSAAPIRATTESSTCVFCHAPHKANPAVPLWNQSLSQGITYNVYQSSTVSVVVPQPQDSDTSKLCLSCHDGTVALGDTVNNGFIPFRNVPTDQRLPASASSNIAGTNLSLADDHPIALHPNVPSNSQLRLPSSGDPVKLDANGKVQCTSCHNAHEENRDTTERRFLVKNNSGAAICLSCHNLKGGTGATLWSWDGSSGSPSSHQAAGNIYNTQTNAGVAYLGAHTRYTTTATNACAACHRPHTAHEAARLLKDETDQVCFQCHDGNPSTALKDLKSEFTRKTYVHPSLGPQANHDPNEAPNNIVSRHAACDDCHNPHAVRPNTLTSNPPQLSGLLLGQSGISQNGTVRDPRRGTGEAQHEFEICFKCHSSSPNQPQSPGYMAYGPLPNRQIRSTNLQQALTSSVSWHPVARMRGLDATEVPSLLSAPVDGTGSPVQGRTLSATSQIYCTDCHNNSSGANLGGSQNGPIGLHGSDNIHILERNYLIETNAGIPGDTPNTPYSVANYALCFKCHSEQNLRSNLSFKKHAEHMNVASCATCHDPHGVPGGNAMNNASLINFDLRIVAPSSDGRLSFTRTLPGQGSCSLQCHGVDHLNKTY